MARDLPSDKAIEAFVSKFITDDYGRNGKVTTSLRKVRKALAERFGVDDEDLKTAKGGFIQEIADREVDKVEKPSPAPSDKPSDDGDEVQDLANSEQEQFSSLDDTEDEGKPAGKRSQISKEPKEKVKNGPGKGKASRGNRKSVSTDRGSSDIQDEEVTKLKKLVVACGVRKQWSKWFSSLDPPAELPKAQIKALRGLLAELGMTGRLSMEAAKRIKEKREFEDELQSIGVHKDEDHVEETRRRSSTSAGKIRTRKSKELSSDDSAEDEDEDADVKPVKRPKFSASLAAFAAELNSSDEE